MLATLDLNVNVENMLTCCPGIVAHTRCYSVRTTVDAIYVRPCLDMSGHVWTMATLMHADLIPT